MRPLARVFSWVARLSTRQDRIECLELLGTWKLGPLIYIDDVVGAFPSADAVSTAVNVGLRRSEMTARAKFNLGPPKTAIMLCFGAVDTSLRHSQCTSYKLLGFHLDSDLSLRERETYLLNIGRALFLELVSLAKTVVSHHQ